MPTSAPEPDLATIADDLAALKKDFAAICADLDSEGARSVVREIEERPLTALLVAFAVGFVASQLLSSITAEARPRPPT